MSERNLFVTPRRKGVPKGGHPSWFLVLFGLLVSCAGVSEGWISPRSGRRGCGFTTNRQQCRCGVSTEREEIVSSCDGTSESSTMPGVWTSCLLKITYDGSRFTGWSSSSTTDDKDETNKITTTHQHMTKRSRKRKQRAGYVRGVEGVFQKHLAKLYGDIDPRRIQIEGCSRTDKGVHAESMIAQVYCLSLETFDYIQVNRTIEGGSKIKGDTKNIPLLSSIPGKRIPHPTNCSDTTYFEPLHFELSKIQFRLNRMLPDDVRVRNIALSPSTTSGRAFHPTLDAVAKTYQYTFSLGPVHDPQQCRYAWHVVGANQFHLDKAIAAAQLLLGTHDFSAFRGAPRGNDDKRRHATQDTTCTITKLDVEEAEETNGHEFDPWKNNLSTTYTVTVTGDRFLYKMVRFLVGAIVAVGADKISLADVKRALETGSWNSQNGNGQTQFKCAPANGLVLQDVEYGTDIRWI